MVQPSTSWLRQCWLILQDLDVMSLAFADIMKATNHWNTSNLLYYSCNRGGIGVDYLYIAASDVTHTASANMHKFRLVHVLHNKFGLHIALACAVGLTDRSIIPQVAGHISPQLPMLWGGKDMAVVPFPSFGTSTVMLLLRTLFSNLLPGDYALGSKLHSRHVG